MTTTTNNPTNMPTNLPTKLYFSPGACSRAVNIALNEAGLSDKVTLVKVDLAAKQCAEGSYWDINPKGSVPAIKFEDGSVLTEAAVIQQYIADCAPNANLAPALGTMERYRLMEMMNHIATDIHKGFSPLWNPKLSDDTKAALKDGLMKRLVGVDKMLEGKEYLLGNYTIADGYLFTVVSWTGMMAMDISMLKNLSAFVARVGNRPAVKTAISKES